MYRFIVVFFLIGIQSVTAQITWVNLDASYAPLPSSIHVFMAIDSIDGKPVVMYYAIANLKDKNLAFTSDTTTGRRLTPTAFYEKNDHPLLVVNTAFFSFETNQNLNVVAKNGRVLSYNVQSVARKGPDTLTWTHPFYSAIGIFRNRTADVAWVYSDSTKRSLYAWQQPVPAFTDSFRNLNYRYIKSRTNSKARLKKWPVETAVGGGPVLVQNYQVNITNNEERKFAGNAVNDLHPRTAIGYTGDDRIIIFVCEGRSTESAGLSLPQLAEIMQSLGCREALNLDGGGSTCMLINGRETNKPSSKGVQRQIPSVFLIKQK